MTETSHTSSPAPTSVTIAHSNDPDSKVNYLLNLVEAQRQKINTMEQQIKAPWQTSCAYLTQNGTRISLQVVKKDDIVKAASDLLQRYDLYKRSCEFLEIPEDPEYLIEGSTFDQWNHDMKKRYSSLDIAEKKKALSKTEETLKDLYSPERKKNNLLADIEKSLEGL